MFIKKLSASDAHVKALIAGHAGVGKTSLARTLPQDETLFFDLEAGTLSIRDLEIDTITANNWPLCRDLAVLLAGPNTEKHPTQHYGQAHYDHCVKKYGEQNFGKYKTLIVDSLTVAGRMCFDWCIPQSLTKEGKQDTRGAYGLMGKELISWATHLQHAKKNVVFLTLLNSARDEDTGKMEHTLQLDGSKAKNELPGIFDEVFTMYIDKEDDNKRKFVCQTPNKFNVPAKDRSSKLDEVELADLGYIFNKINS